MIPSRPVCERRTAKEGKVAVNRSTWRHISRHLAAHATLYVFLLVLAATIAVTVQFPVYFRADDVRYMSWSAAHPNPLSAFMLSEPTHDGMFRPLNTLVWWLCYRLFGLNPVPYQLVIGLVYGMSFVFLFKLVALVFSRRAAVFSLIAYLAVFSKLTYIIFWFSDMTFALEVLLINLSLYLLVSAAVRTTRWLPWGVLAYIGASLAKEPATLIVPIVAAVFLATRWATLPDQHRRKVAAVLLTIFIVGIAVTVWTPFVRDRQALTLSMGLQAAVAFVVARLRFYGAELLAGGGILIWFASLYLMLVSWAKRKSFTSRPLHYLFLGLAAAGALLATRAPGTGLVLLCLSLVLILTSRATASAAAVWAALPLISILTVRMMTRTYLVEASFGLAVLVGVASAECLERLAADLRRLRPVSVRVMWAVLLALLCVAVFAETPAFRARLHALSVVSATRQNFRDAVLFTRDHLDEEGYELIVVDYAELGINYGRDVGAAGDIDKVRRQKTMVSREVEMLLRLLGAEHVDVHKLQWFHEGGDGQVFFMAMNGNERDHILALSLDLDLLYEVERLGEGAWIYRLAGRGPVRPVARDDIEGPHVASGVERVRHGGA
jgi:hypothetical protein